MIIRYNASMQWLIVALFDRDARQSSLCSEICVLTILVYQILSLGRRKWTAV